MRIFTEQKTEWLIGVSCAFLPAALSRFISFTEEMPDVTIPFWLLCIFISAPLGYFAAKQFSKRTKDIANKNFSVQKEHVDGKHYANCTFDGTELIFFGTRNFSLSGNHFSTTLRLSFDGYASVTIKQLVVMYGDPGFRPFIDATFDQIKKKGFELEHSNNS